MLVVSLIAERLTFAWLIVKRGQHALPSAMSLLDTPTLLSSELEIDYSLVPVLEAISRVGAKQSRDFRWEELEAWSENAVFVSGDATVSEWPPRCLVL